MASVSVAARPYRSPLRDDRARRTRQCVLEAATEVFPDRGYAGATVRAVATRAGVSVPTVEALFGTKARLLKAAIDVAIAGDDEPVPVLDRPSAQAAGKAENLSAFLLIVAGLVADAQQRSAGLVLAVFEGSSRDAELEALRRQMVAQREATAAWVVRGMTRLAQLRPGYTADGAVDVVWLLMDPALFVRLTRQRHWSAPHYRDWLADALARLLVTDTPGAAQEERHR